MPVFMPVHNVLTGFFGLLRFVGFAAEAEDGLDSIPNLTELSSLTASQTALTALSKPSSKPSRMKPPASAATVLGLLMPNTPLIASQMPHEHVFDAVQQGGNCRR
jgi:hypothetical protein